MRLLLRTWRVNCCPVDPVTATGVLAGAGAGVPPTLLAVAVDVMDGACRAAEAVEVEVGALVVEVVRRAAEAVDVDG